MLERSSRRPAVRRDRALGAEGVEEGEVRSALGRRIRELRTGRRLSGRELALAARVSPGFISQVERGQVMPSVATLLRIASALGVLMGDLFAAPEAASSVVRAGERVVYKHPEARFQEAKVSADRTGRLEVQWASIRPGGGTGEELLVHGSDAELVFVLTGELEVRAGDETAVLRSGDSMTFPGTSPHGCWNRGPRPVELLWITTPAVY